MTVVQRLRHWFADQWAGPDRKVDSCNWMVLADSEEVGTDTENDAGMSTVEYAVGTIAAAAFAAVLYKIVTGDSVVAGLTALVNSALHTTL